MKNTARLMYVTMLSLLLGSFVYAEDNVPKSPAIEVSCILKISSDPDILPLSDEMIQFMFQSKGVYAKAVNEIFGEYPSNDGPITFTANLVGHSSASRNIPETPNMMDSGAPKPDSVLLYALTIKTKNDAASKFMMALIRNLQETLEKPYISRQDELKDHLGAVIQQIEHKELSLRVVHEQKNNDAIAGITNPDELQERINNLKTNIRELDIKCRLIQKWLEQLSEERKEITQKMDESIANDAIINELTTLIDGVAKEITTTESLVMAGKCEPVKLSEVQEKLLRLKIELAKRKEDLKDKAGQRRLMEINERERKLYSENTESELYRDMMFGQLGEATNLLKKTGDMAIKDINYNATKESLQKLLQEKESLKNQLIISKKPSILIIGETE